MTVEMLKKFAVLALAINLFSGNYAAAETKSPSQSLLLYLNSGQGDLNVVKEFIKQGADVNVRDEQYLITPLHNAIHYKHTEVAKVLISHGADVNAKNVEGNTPLYVAIHQEQEEITDILLGKGADVNAKNNYGYTPLRAACKWGNNKLIELLVSKDADVNVKDKKGDTPLHVAADEGYTKTVKILIDHGANINAIGAFGDAPIHLAVTRGYTEIVSLLISNGADLSIRDGKGNTASDLAILEGKQEIIELLKNSKLVLNELKIKNYRYYLSFGQKFIQLKNGNYKSGSNPDDYISAKLENYAVGDLNKDGNDDAVVILSSQGMGSGTFYELTALILKDKNINQTNSIVIGDRIKIKSLSIELGEIILDVVTHKPEDPSYRPSQKFIQRFRLDDKKLVEIKPFTFNFPEIKEIKPEPYQSFVMEHDYFTCLIPAKWKLERDKEGGEKAGIFEIKLTKPDKAKPEDGKRYFFSDPLIYAGYYAKNNNQHKTYESFIMDYEKLLQKSQGSDKARYEKPKNIIFNGKEANEQVYEVYQAIPRGPLFTTEYWLKAKFIVVKAKNGFYVLAYKSPKEFYDNYLPIFEEVVKSFKPAD